MRPTLDAVARLYAAVLGDDPAAESRVWLHWFIGSHPELSKLWAKLEEPTETGPSLLELASLVFAAGTADPFPEGGPMLDELLSLDDHTRDLRDQLRQMATDLDPDRLPADRWATEALRIHRLFDRLVESLGSVDPSETLDPAGFRGAPYEHLVAICNTRLRRMGQGPRDTSEPTRAQLESLRALLLRHLRRDRLAIDFDTRVGQLEAWLHHHDPAAELAEWLEETAAEIREAHKLLEN